MICFNRLNIFFLILSVLVYCKGSEVQNVKSEETKSIQESAQSKKEILISTASSLRCRKLPDSNASIVTEFKYATFLGTNKTNDTKISIDGKSDYWYYVEKNSCWVFGGFTLKTDTKEVIHYPLNVLVAPERTACGGASCMPNLGEVTIAGKYFLTPVDFSDYCMDENATCYGKLIGEVILSPDRISLGKTIEIGTFNEKQKWLGKIEGYKKNFNYKDSATLIAVKQKGIFVGYYADSSYDTRPKEEVEKDCVNQKDICARYYIPKPLKVY